MTGAPNSTASTNVSPTTWTLSFALWDSTSKQHETMLRETRRNHATEKREQNSRYPLNNGLRFFSDCAAKKWPLRGSPKFGRPVVAAADRVRRHSGKRPADA